MYKIITASSDNYITNKYVNNFRVTDSNVGSAGTLDLYKLYNENPVNDGDLVELSRLLIKFDLDPVRNIHNNICSVGNPSFKAVLKMQDIYGGQTTPSNYDIHVYPLSQSFDEGIGRDVVRYTDLGSSNFLTASFKDGQINLWNTAGANALGQSGDELIDVVSTADFGEGAVNTYGEQNFETGKEDLEIDVTQIISGTIKGDIPDYGFRVSFSPAIEQNEKTYFVKRFSSRNAKDPTMRPQLIIKYNDSIHDYHKSMNFNISGSLFLNNIVNGSYKNILSGSTSSPGTFEEVSGDDCILLKIFTGSYEKYVTGSSHKIGDISKTGIYSASFLVDSFDDNLVEHVNSSGSIVFTTVWTDFSENIPYHSGSFKINTSNVSSFSNSTSRLIISITNLRKSYYRDSLARFRVFVDDVDKVIPYVKRPIKKDSEIYYNMKYSIIDVDTGKSIIPFQKNDNSTVLSVDSDGMYFDLDMSSLPPKRVYKISFLLSEIGQDRVFSNTASIFRVV